jgi:N-acetylmuramoyl-L-alanine amidase
MRANSLLFCALFTFIFALEITCFLNVVHAKTFLVVIDPGHGGNDQGAAIQVGKNSVQEKDMTLLLAKEFKSELKKLKIESELTREGDEFLALEERTAFANRKQASIFISLHMNSLIPQGGMSVPEGFESYILNTTTDESSKRLADLENQVLRDSKVTRAAQTSDIALIVKDFILDANLKPSKELACAIQMRTSEAGRDRGVRQALFYVLLGADMPSILLEAGFIAHPKDRDRILDPKTRTRFAKRLALAIQDFRKRRKVPKIGARLRACKVLE